MTRAILYCRVSTEEQGTNYSLPTQLDACRRYALQHDMTIVGEYSDMLSGARLDRPGLEAARAALRGGAADALIVYSQDRLSRNLAHLLLLRDEFMTVAGIAVHAVTRGQSADTPEGRLFDAIEGSFAEYERMKIRERSIRGKRGKLEAGKVLGQGGSAPYGYRWVGRRHEKEMVICDEEAAAVRQIATWYLDGVGVADICRRLDAAGIPTPADSRAVNDQHFTGRGSTRRGGWARATVYSILRDEKYAGAYHFPSHNLTVTIPAIITPAQWAAIQAQLATGRLMSPRNRKRFYLFSHRVRCQCGAAMAGRTDVYKNTGKEHRTYCCTSRVGMAVNPCTYRPYFSADLVEETVWDWIVREVLVGEHIIEAAAAVRETSAERRAALLEERDTYQRQIEAAASRAGKLVQLFDGGIFTLEEVAEQKRAIDAARTSAQTELARVEQLLAQEGPAQRDVDELVTLAEELQARIAAGLTDETRRRIIDLLDTTITLSKEDDQRYVDVVCRLTADSERLVIVPEQSASSKHNYKKAVEFRARLPLAA